MFIVMWILWLLLIVLGTYLVPQLSATLEPPHSEHDEEEDSGISLGQFIYNETVISLFLMMYSQVAVMPGNFLPVLLQKAGRAVLYLALALNVTAAGVSAMTQNTTGMVIALLTLGVCASFAKPFQQTYYLNRKPSRLYGEDKAMGIYSFTENIGESLRSIILSGVMSSSLSVILVFLGGIFVCGELHLILNAREK